MLLPDFYLRDDLTELDFKASRTSLIQEKFSDLLAEETEKLIQSKRN